MLTTTSDYLFFLWPRAQWLGQSPQSRLVLRECLREETTAADCGVAGAGGEAEVDRPFIVLTKCFLASEGTRASGNL